MSCLNNDPTSFFHVSVRGEKKKKKNKEKKRKDKKEQRFYIVMDIS